jgi:uncharacterized membrane protein
VILKHRSIFISDLNTLIQIDLGPRRDAVMLNGSICTVEEQTLFNSTRGTSIVCLTREDSIGLTLVAESGFISLVAVLGVFILIFVGMNGFVPYSKLIML